jgi:hypothetical protein
MTFLPTHVERVFMQNVGMLTGDTPLFSSADRDAAVRDG